MELALCLYVRVSRLLSGIRSGRLLGNPLPVSKYQNITRLWLHVSSKLCVYVRVFLCTARYDVVEGDVVADLDVYDGNALDVGDGGYFRRSATIPTQDANIDLTDAIAAGGFSRPGTDRTFTK